MKYRHLFTCTLALTALLLTTGCKLTPTASKQIDPNAPKPDAEGFVPIFNGTDLTGWTPNFAGEACGVNYKDTFAVEDGVLKVHYNNYETFDGKFGHLFYDTPVSSFILRLDYRFVGEQLEGGPSYGWINSGIMFHSQSPESMFLEQEFPTSVEVQTLGVPEGYERQRTTANICTPGTNVFTDGRLNRNHCINSSSETYPLDEWVSLELEVHGHGKVIHRVNGEVVMEYEKCQLDPNDGRDNNSGAKIAEANGGKLELSSGYLALQAESHPVQFRNIRIKVLDE